MRPADIAASASTPSPDAVKLLHEKARPIDLAAQYDTIVAGCLDTMAMCARHRATRRLDERSAEEDRILALLDAIVVCPRFAHSIFGWWSAAREQPDPWKIWAPAFVIASAEGGDVVSALTSLVEPLESELDALGIAGEAVALGPRTDVAAVAAALLRDPQPAARALGVEVEWRLGALSVAQAVEALGPDSPPAVRWAACRASAQLPAERRIDDLLLEHLHREPDSRILWEATRALTLRGLPAAYHALRWNDSLASRLGPKALLALALLGDEADAALARKLVARHGTSEAVIRGLARYGHPGAAPILLDALGDEDASDDAADALQWLFGPLPDATKSAVPGVWREHIARARPNDRERLRFGKPYRPSHVLEALRLGRIGRLDLDFMFDEAMTRTGVRHRVDLWRFSSDSDAIAAQVAASLALDAGDSWACVARSRRAR
jgi:hypothetical protein